MQDRGWGRTVAVGGRFPVGVDAVEEKEDGEEGRDAEDPPGRRLSISLPSSLTSGASHRKYFPIIFLILQRITGPG